MLSCLPAAQQEQDAPVVERGLLFGAFLLIGGLKTMLDGHDIISSVEPMREEEKYEKAVRPFQNSGTGGRPLLYDDEKRGLFQFFCLRSLAEATTIPVSAKRARVLGMTIRLLNISVSSQTRSLETSVPMKMKARAIRE